MTQTTIYALMFLIAVSTVMVLVILSESLVEAKSAWTRALALELESDAQIKDLQVLFPDMSTLAFQMTAIKNVEHANSVVNLLTALMLAAIGVGILGVLLIAMSPL